MTIARNSALDAELFGLKVPSANHLITHLLTRKSISGLANDVPISLKSLLGISFVSSVDISLPIVVVAVGFEGVAVVHVLLTTQVEVETTVPVLVVVEVVTQSHPPQPPPPPHQELAGVIIGNVISYLHTSDTKVIADLSGQFVPAATVSKLLTKTP
jgi:hypothetical protein